MSGGLIDDLQAAAARMGLPPLEFHTHLAQRIQAGDVQDLVTGYMDLLAEYQATRVWFLDVLDAAFEAGWTRRPGSITASHSTRRRGPTPRGSSSRPSILGTSRR